jgi:hypothetical protein
MDSFACPPAHTPAGDLKTTIQFPHREALIAEPVLQFPNAQCGVHEGFASGTAIVDHVGITDLPYRRLLHGTGPVLSPCSRPSA